MAVSVIKEVFGSYEELKATGRTYIAWISGREGYSSPAKAFGTMLRKPWTNGWDEGQRLAVYRDTSGKWFPMFEKTGSK